jgi:hypothetical protein
MKINNISSKWLYRIWISILLGLSGFSFAQQGTLSSENTFYTSTHKICINEHETVPEMEEIPDDSWHIDHNPAMEQFTVYGSMEEFDEINLKIINSWGKVLLDQKIEAFTSFSKVFSTQNVINGVYFIEVEKGDRLSRKKLVIE